MLDLTGHIYGRLEVKELVGTNKHGGAVWKCLCSCGNPKMVEVSSNHLRRGNTKSCGCLNSETRAQLCRSRSKHGHAKKSKQSPTYIAWCNMIARCQPDSEDAEHYFARGIDVCDRWLAFENFLIDMGERPDGMTLDRRDNDKGYAPENCRWTTWETQQNNSRKNRILLIRGEWMTMKQASRRFGINYNTLRSRIYLLGQSAEKAVGA